MKVNPRIAWIAPLRRTYSSCVSHQPSRVSKHIPPSQSRAPSPVPVPAQAQVPPLPAVPRPPLRHITPRDVLRGVGIGSDPSDPVPFRVARIPPSWLTCWQQRDWHGLVRLYRRYLARYDAWAAATSPLDRATQPAKRRRKPQQTPEPLHPDVIKLVLLAMARLGQWHDLQELLRHATGLRNVTVIRSRGDTAQDEERHDLAAPFRDRTLPPMDTSWHRSYVETVMVALARDGKTEVIEALYQSYMQLSHNAKDDNPMNPAKVRLMMAARFCGFHEVGDPAGMLRVWHEYLGMQGAYLQRLRLAASPSSCLPDHRPLSEDDEDDEVASMQSLLTSYPDVCWRWLELHLPSGGGDWSIIQRHLFDPRHVQPAFPVTGDTLDALLRLTDPYLIVPSEAMHTAAAGATNTNGVDAGTLRHPENKSLWREHRRIRYHFLYCTLLPSLQTHHIPKHTRTRWLRRYAMGFQRQRERLDRAAEYASPVSPMDPFDRQYPSHSDETMEPLPFQHGWPLSNHEEKLDPYDERQFDMLLAKTPAHIFTPSQHHLILRCFMWLNRRYEVAQWLRQHTPLGTDAMTRVSEVVAPVPSGLPTGTQASGTMDGMMAVPDLSTMAWPVRRDMFLASMRTGMLPSVVSRLYRALYPSTVARKRTDGPSTRMHNVDEAAFFAYIGRAKGAMEAWRLYQEASLWRRSSCPLHRKRLFYHVFFFPLLGHPTTQTTTGGTAAALATAVPCLSTVARFLQEAMPLLLPPQAEALHDSFHDDTAVIQLSLLRFDLRSADGTACDRALRRLIMLVRRSSATPMVPQQQQWLEAAAVIVLEAWVALPLQHVLHRHMLARAVIPWAFSAEINLPSDLMPCRHFILADTFQFYGLPYRLLKLAYLHRHCRGAMGTAEAQRATWRSMAKARLATSPLHAVMEEHPALTSRQRSDMRIWFNRYLGHVLTTEDIQTIVKM